MRRKKHFISPQVLNQVEVCLEKDLLGASVRMNTRVIIEGHETKDHDVSYMNDNIESYWE